MGLGTLMISYAEECARSLGFEQLELDIFSTNERAPGYFIFAIGRRKKWTIRT